MGRSRIGSLLMVDQPTTTHPDYLGYVVEKRKVLPRAKWHDIKFLMRKILDVELDRVYVQRVDHNDWRGWLVDFSVDTDLAECQRLIAKCTVVGKRSIFIGVNHG